MTEGPLSHWLIKARELTEGRKDLDGALRHIDAALLIVRRIHHDG